MFALGFLLPVFSMYVGIAVTITMGRLDDWQYGSGLGLLVGGLAAAFVMLSIRLGRLVTRPRLTREVGCFFDGYLIRRFR
jgi:hypothetical protein